MKSLMFIFICIFTVIKTCESVYAYVTWAGSKASISVSDHYADIPDYHIARATYQNKINLTGWAFLELHTSSNVSDEKQVYSAGYLEGFLTRDLIWMHWQNMLKSYCVNKTDVCSLIDDFVNKNEQYISSMIELNPNDPYWYQTKLYYTQIEGLTAGYNDATSDPYEHLSYRDIIDSLYDERFVSTNLGDFVVQMGSMIFTAALSGTDYINRAAYDWINMLGDLDELAFAVTMPKENPEGFLFGDHCTGLVKLLPDLSDLYVSQVTWNSYQSMMRIQKMYVINVRVLPYSEQRIPGRKMSFTSYPAFVQSTDDFYIISSGLVAAETTIGNTNRTLFQYVKPVGQIMEYVRAMIANRLARSGREWAQIFRKHNSGTYNNQWYIVDYNKFRARTAERPAKIDPGLLWVIEQLPVYTEAADLTKQLLLTTYFPSYNIPYFPNIFNLSGGNWRVETYGDWFGYHTNPRAKIIKEKQATIRNIRDMFHVMRYNDYKHDPLSRCEQCSPPYSACNAIAARNDLNPANGTYPFRALGHRSHGATDAKVTSSRLRTTFQFVAVSSPTHNITRGIPPFAWSEFDMGPYISHVGHPDIWVFPPLVHAWEWN